MSRIKQLVAEDVNEFDDLTTHEQRIGAVERTVDTNGDIAVVRRYPNHAR